jgi:hypothetical protein
LKDSGDLCAKAVSSLDGDASLVSAEAKSAGAPALPAFSAAPATDSAKALLAAFEHGQRALEEATKPDKKVAELWASPTAKTDDLSAACQATSGPSKVPDVNLPDAVDEAAFTDALRSTADIQRLESRSACGKLAQVSTIELLADAQLKGHLPLTACGSARELLANGPAAATVPRLNAIVSKTCK